MIRGVCLDHPLRVLVYSWDTLFVAFSWSWETCNCDQVNSPTPVQAAERPPDGLESRTADWRVGQAFRKCFLDLGISWRLVCGLLTLMPPVVPNRFGSVGRPGWVGALVGSSHTEPEEVRRSRCRVIDSIHQSMKLHVSQEHR